jgi:phage terminase small subunit
MPMLLNTRHERFALLLVEGQSAAEAYVLAGYKENRHNASALARSQPIKARTAELFAQRDDFERKSVERAVVAASVDRTWILERLRENAERALQAVEALDKKGRPTGEYVYDGAVANRALELLGKELGMFIDRKHITRSSSFAEMDFDQLLAIAQGRAPAPQIEHSTTDVFSVEPDDQDPQKP